MVTSSCTLRASLPTLPALLAPGRSFHHYVPMIALSHDLRDYKLRGDGFTQAAHSDSFGGSRMVTVVAGSETTCLASHGPGHSASAVIRSLPSASLADLRHAPHRPLLHRPPHLLILGLPRRRKIPNFNAEIAAASFPFLNRESA